MAEQSYFGTKNSFVEQRIRDAIVRREALPGDWLRPEEWAHRLGVSQTPVREALRKLEAQGLVVFHPHRGAQVVSLEMQGFVEVYRIRAVLEGLATKLAVSESTDEELVALLQMMDETEARYERAALAHDNRAMRQANRDFHMAIYSAAKSGRLFQMIENLWATFPWDTLALVPGRPAEALAEHKELIAAARDRNANRAGEAMRRHVEAAAEALIHHLEMGEEHALDMRGLMLSTESSS